MGEETWVDGKPYYNGAISQIHTIGSFQVKVMVRDGETREQVRDLLGSEELGLLWNTVTDVIKVSSGC